MMRHARDSDTSNVNPTYTKYVICSPAICTYLGLTFLYTFSLIGQCLHKEILKSNMLAVKMSHSMKRTTLAKNTWRTPRKNGQTRTQVTKRMLKNMECTCFSAQRFIQRKRRTDTTGTFCLLRYHPRKPLRPSFQYRILVRRCTMLEYIAKLK